MVPLSSILSMRDMSGPVMVMRYNMYRAAAVNGNPAAGVSSGQAISLLENTVKQDLPATMRYEWTELALLQLQTGNTAMWVFLNPAVAGQGRVRRHVYVHNAGRLFCPDLLYRHAMAN